ncbi:MAG: dihydroorotase [Caulobacteraceae bacterium]|nr:dihydroorotase [Caulobacteraceae bacterium]
MARTQPIAFVNARVLDPESRYDGPGCVVAKDGAIADVRRSPSMEGSADLRVIDCNGAVLAPGLIDLRVKSGEPGAEHKETLASVAKAAAAGGVTAIVLQPDTAPPVDEPAMVDFVLRRGRDIETINIHVAGAATRGLSGEHMAEIGLMDEAGAIYFTDADRPIVNSKVMRRVLEYAGAFNALVSHRPADPFLSEGAVATEGELAARLGLPSAPAIAERIMLERDLALVELTGARFLVDQISTAGALDSLRRARDKGLEVAASCSINHLSFNEVDVGDYRTFYRLDPPLRPESDRQALIEAIAEGLIDAVVSAHAPSPAGEKRRPFSEAAPGAVGLETLFPALLNLHHDAGVPLIDLIRAVTLGPAQLLGLPGGRIASGAPADLVLVDIDAPIQVIADRLNSKSKNSPFDGRRLQGEVLLTMVDGRIVHQAPQ